MPKTLESLGFTKVKTDKPDEVTLESLGFTKVNKDVEDLGFTIFPNAESYLKSREDLAKAKGVAEDLKRDILTGEVEPEPTITPELPEPPPEDVLAPQIAPPASTMVETMPEGLEPPVEPVIGEIPEETIGKVAEITQRPLDFMNRARRIKQEPDKFIPFVADIRTIKGIAQIFGAIQRLKSDELQEGDLELLEDYSNKGKQDTTFWYKVLDTVAAMPAFIGEFWSTFGVYSFGGKVGVKALTEATKKLLTKSGEKLLKKKISKIALKGVEIVAGGTLQAPVMGALRITADTIERTMPEFILSENDKNEIKGFITGEGKNLGIALTESLGMQWVETVSEHSGIAFTGLGRAVKNVAIKHGLLKSFMKANPGARVNDFKKVVQKFGYHGMLSEIGEERVGEVGRAILGLEKYRFPSKEQLLVELVSFSVPGVLAQTGELIARRGEQPSPPPSPQVEIPPEPPVPTEQYLKDIEVEIEEMEIKQIEGKAPTPITEVPVTEPIPEVQPGLPGIPIEEPKVTPTPKAPTRRVYGDKTLIREHELTEAMALARTAGNFEGSLKAFDNIYVGDSPVSAQPFAKMNPKDQLELDRLENELRLLAGKRGVADNRASLKAEIKKLKSGITKKDITDDIVYRYNEERPVGEQVADWSGFLDIITTDLQKLLEGDVVAEELEVEMGKYGGFTKDEFENRLAAWHDDLIEAGYSEEEIALAETDYEVFDRMSEEMETKYKKEFDTDEQAEIDRIAEEQSKSEVQKELPSVVEGEEVTDEELKTALTEWDEIAKEEEVKPTEVAPEVMPEEKPVVEKLPENVDYTTAALELTDARTGETIEKGEPIYYFTDTKESVKVSTYKKMVEKVRQETLFPEEVTKPKKEFSKNAQKFIDEAKKHPDRIPNIINNRIPDYIISLGMQREFGEEAEDFLKRRPDIAKRQEELRGVIETLKTEKPVTPPVAKDILDMPISVKEELQQNFLAELDEQEDLFKKPSPRKITKPVGENLEFNPKNLEKTKTKEFIEESDKLVKRSTIAKQISERLNVPIRHGKYRGKALGIFKQKPEIIRIKAGDIVTISHEVGHYLDTSMPVRLSEKINTAEINALIKEYEVTEATNITKESFGEFLRFYITDPSKAKRLAPNFSKYFNDTLDSYPEIKDALLSARNDYQRWLQLPATAKVLSNISMEQEKLGIKEKITGTLEEIYKTTFDDLYPLKQFVTLAKKEGIEVEAEENPYILARILKGQISKANVFLEKGTFNKKFWGKTEKGTVPIFTGKSLRQALNPIKGEGALEDFSIYLTSIRTIELNRRNIQTGINVDDAKDAVKELKNKYPEFSKVRQDIYDFQNAVLEYGLQSGLYSKKTLNIIKSANKYYVPFYRVFEEIQNKGYMGKGFSDISNQLKKIKGSERDIINPLESIVKNTYMILNAADRNQVGIMMARLAGMNRELGRLFENIPTPMAKVAQVSAKELGIDIKTLSEDDLGKVVDIFRPSMFVPKDNIQTVLIGGEKKYFQVHPDIYKAMAATEKETMGLVMKILSAPAGWLRAGAILSPDFAVRNPLRDVMTAYVYSEYGFIPVVDNMRAVFSLVNKDKDYWLWRMGGGDQSMMVSMDRKYLKKSFEEIVKEHKFTDYLKSPLEALRIISEVSEKLNRLPEAKNALSKGKSPIEAGFASREITLDFAKGGAFSRSVNAIIAFWKANVLDMEKIVVTFKNHPTRTMAKVVSGITVPSIILYMINRDDERWKEIPQWQKNLFWIIMTDKHIYRIPKPFTLGILFGSIPERILEYIDNKDPKVIDELASNIIHGLSPGIIPTALSPLIENMSNYNFFLARPIVPKYRKDMPPEAQYTGYTSEAAKKLGAWVNYSPAKIDNLLQGYFAGLGKYAIDALDVILKGTGISPNIPKPDPTLADIPVIKAFVVRRPIGSASESVNKFYDEMKITTARERMLKEYLNKNEKEKYYKYKNKYPELLFRYDWKTKGYYSAKARYLRAIARDISEVRKIERKIYDSKTMSSKDKRIKIDEIDETITKYVQKALSKKFK